MCVYIYNSFLYVYICIYLNVYIIYINIMYTKEGVKLVSPSYKLKDWMSLCPNNEKVQCEIVCRIVNR